jgi:hypothetical protein
VFISQRVDTGQFSAFDISVFRKVTQHVRFIADIYSVYSMKLNVDNLVVSTTLGKKSQSEG